MAGHTPVAKRITGPIGALLPQLEEFLQQARATLPEGELQDRAAELLQALAKAAAPHRPRGKYWWGGRWRRHDWGRIMHRLGKESDGDLAAEIGCSRLLVWRERTNLGIPAFDPLKALDPLLGTMPDGAVARRTGVKRTAVARRREQLGIKPFRHRAPEHPRGLENVIEGLDRARRVSSGKTPPRGL